jgi:hypothetical protein
MSGTLEPDDAIEWNRKEYEGIGMSDEHGQARHAAEEQGAFTGRRFIEAPRRQEECRACEERERMAEHRVESTIVEEVRTPGDAD